MKDMSDSAPAAALGLIGGLGVPATMHYYRQLVGALEKDGREAPIVIVHAKMSRAVRYLQAGDLDGLAGYLAGLIGRTAAAGATLAAIPAVTPHICAVQLARLSPLPFVNILDAIVDDVTRRGLIRVALFGTRYTIESRLFGRLGRLDVVMPTAHEIDSIHETYLRIAGEEGDPQEHSERLRELAKAMCLNGLS